VNIRFYIDPELGQPHIIRHNVTEREVEEVLTRPMEDRPGSDGSRVALGQTAAGRYLRIIYVPDPEPDSMFVITGYDLGPKAKRALKRRRRRKP
jgi:hypothetical protein